MATFVREQQSKIQSKSQSIVQSMVQSTVQSPAELVGGTITKIRVHDSVFGLPGGMAMAHWPLWQSNGTKNTSFQESSPESSPVQNPGPVQGIVLPAHHGVTPP